jgi:putative colanic acid biosynthesis glycosyltransferase WcaI
LIFTVSPQFKLILEERGCRNVIFNPIGYDDFEIVEEVARFRREELLALFNSDVEFLIVYAGTFGHVIEVDSLLKAANILRSHNRIGFLLVGDGQNLQYYQDAVSLTGANVTFTGRVSKSEVAQICRNCDVAYYGSREGDASNAMLGNKIFDFLGAGLPIIYHGPSSAVRNLLQEANCSMFSNFGDDSLLVEHILKMYSSPAMREDMKVSAINLIGRRYLAAKSAEEFWENVESI